MENDVSPVPFISNKKEAFNQLKQTDNILC